MHKFSQLTFVFLLVCFATFSSAQPDDNIGFDIYYGWNQRAYADGQIADKFLDAGPGRVYGASFYWQNEVFKNVMHYSLAMGILEHNVQYTNLDVDLGYEYGGHRTNFVTLFVWAKIDVYYLFKKQLYANKIEVLFGPGISINSNIGDASGASHFVDSFTGETYDYWQFWTNKDTPRLFPNIGFMTRFNYTLNETLLISISPHFEISPFSETKMNYKVASKYENEQGVFYQRFANFKIALGIGL